MGQLKLDLNAEGKKRLKAVRQRLVDEIARFEKANAESRALFDKRKALEAELREAEAKVDLTDDAQLERIASLTTQIGVLTRRINAAESRDRSRNLTPDHIIRLGGVCVGVGAVIREILQPQYHVIHAIITQKLSPFWLREEGTQQAHQTDVLRNFGAFLNSLENRLMAGYDRAEQLMGFIDSMLEGRFPFTFPFPTPCEELAAIAATPETRG